MNQRKQAWIAIRAVAVIEHEGDRPALAKLLRPRVHAAAIGAWISDLCDAKLGSPDTRGQILKLEPHGVKRNPRLALEKADLIERLGNARVMEEFLEQDGVLSPSWWKRPYKADPPPGQHLGNTGALREMAYSTPRWRGSTCGGCSGEGH